MGARTDFVRAMVFGAIAGVAITTAVFQLRSTSCPAVPTCPPAAPPRVHIEPVPSPPAAVDAAAAAAVSPRTQPLVDRLAKLGIPVGEINVACTVTCCELSLDDTAYDEHADPIKAALEITAGTPWQSRKVGTVRIIERCW